MRIQLLHLDGPHRGRTITYPDQELLFGSAQDADVRYAEGLTVRARHARITFDEAAGAFFFKALEGEVFVNHREVEEIILEPNDLIEIGRHGPKMRFRVHAGGKRVQKPVMQMLRDAREVGQASGVVALTRSMRQDLMRHATPRLKIGFPLAVLAIVLGLFWWQARRDAGRQERQAEEIARLTDQIAAFQAKVRESEISYSELERLRNELARHTAVMDDLRKRDAALKRVLSVYSRGVCLLHTAFEMHGPDGPVKTRDGKTYRAQHTGSGFLVSDKGEVITNRHVAEPWWKRPGVARLQKLGFVPRLVHFTACFPGHMPVPVDVTSIRVAPGNHDVAVIRVSAPGVPVLPLNDGALFSHRGGRVIVLGYPTGMTGLMARADPADVPEILRVSTLAGRIRELAKRNAIAPIITQGSLNEVRENQLVYDAATTFGGSGGPVFGPDGTVVGVSHAGLPGFDASNFGVPIRYAKALLE